jgi:hypothetical protein
MICFGNVHQGEQLGGDPLSLSLSLGGPRRPIRPPPVSIRSSFLILLLIPHPAPAWREEEGEEEEGEEQEDQKEEDEEKEEEEEWGVAGGGTPWGIPLGVPWEIPPLGDTQGVPGGMRGGEPLILSNSG